MNIENSFQRNLILDEPKPIPTRIIVMTSFYESPLHNGWQNLDRKN